MLVDGVTKLDKVTYGDAAQAETVRKMVVAMSQDIRVLVIKLADRLHNARTWKYVPRAQGREEGPRDARDLRAAGPPAGHEHDQVGAGGPLLRHPLPEGLRRDRAARRRARARPARSTWRWCASRSRPTCGRPRSRRTVTGRPKHYYSVYQKMIVRGRDFADIYDLVGVRVLVDSVRDCYAVLGALHARWNPVPGRFKDYIAMPKFNMYQSLHTTVIGPEGKPVEIQIRTHQMHRRAEYGVAAHWKYKDDRRATARDERRRQRHGVAAAAARLAARDRRPRRVPRLAALRDQRGRRSTSSPRRATSSRCPPSRRPVDFAYAVHTEVGHRMHGRPGQRPAGAAGEQARQRRRRRDLHLEDRRRRARRATG